VKSVVKFYLCALCVLCGLKTSAAFSDIKSDMDMLANQAATISDAFMQKSVELRLGYEFRQGFALDTQAQNLRDLAQKAAAGLDEILLAQEKLKKQIENYNGEDWDARYGDSGVWRMAGEDICATKILKCRMEYYRALASPPHQQAGIVRDGLAMLAGVADVPQVLLVKADAYALLGKTSNVETHGRASPLAGELYRKIMETENSRDLLYYTAAVAAQKLDPPLSTAVLDELAAQIDKSENKDTFELTMSLAFLQRRLGSTAILEKAAKRWPQTKTFVGDLILSDLRVAWPVETHGMRLLPGHGSPPSLLSKLTPFEADCVAAAALQNEPSKYSDVLEAMSRVAGLQTSYVLYAAAVAQSQKSPARAIELFIKASLLPCEPNDGGESPVNIAKQGAALALNFFGRGEPMCSPSADPNRSMGVSPMSSRCEIAKRAVENYFALADAAADAQIEYLYCDVLSDCGDKKAAEKLLQKIAAVGADPCVCPLVGATGGRPVSEFSRRAKQDLETLAINKSLLLLEQGQLFEAANVLIAADVNVCDCREHTANLLERYVDKIDEYIDQTAPNRVLTLLGLRLIGCNDTQSGANATLLYAQAAIFDANGQKDKLDEIEKLLKPIAENNLDFLTARARLSTAQGNYAAAAKQWAAICQIVKAQPDEPPQHSYKWWQAKYLELANSLKIPSANRADIIHSIEVLQSSFDQIPPFWDKKLRSLTSP
jgi:hypothetical protein